MGDMEEETLAEFLKRIRKKKGISQRKLAKLTGVDREYIVQVEGGKVKSMRLSQAKKASCWSRCSPRDIPSRQR